MSASLMGAVFRAALPSTQKFVLLAIADNANDAGECYPAVLTIAAKCSLGQRTVQEAMAALEASGNLTREFRNGRSTLYRVVLTPATSAPLVETPPAESAPLPPTHAVAAGVRLVRGRGAVAAGGGAVAAGGGAVAAPITLTKPLPNPQGDRKRARAAPAPDFPKPDDVGDTTWSDWCALRKAKKATVSATVVKGARDEAGKAGMALEAFLAEWCVRGSQGLKASWLEPRQTPGTLAPRPGGNASRGPRTQAEVDEVNARNTEEARLRLFGPTPQQEIFDA